MRIDRLVLAGLLLFVTLPALGQKVHVDYDNATAFSEYKTFQIRPTSRDLRRVSHSLHDHVVQRLSEYALEGALTVAASDPDVYIVYYAAYWGELELTLNDLEYAYGESFTPGTYWDGGVGTRDVTKKTFRFKEGTLIVDVWDRERRLLVWRGMATAALKRDYHKNEKKLSKALDKLMNQWDEMHGNRARAIRQLKAEQN